MKRSFAYSVMAVLVCSANLSQASDVVIEGNGVSITVHDIQRYLSDTVPEDKKAEVYKKDSIIKEAAESLLIIKSLSKQAESAGIVNEDNLAWSAELYKSRARMEQLLAYEQEKVLSRVNWDAAANEVYIADESKFYQDERVNASHILVKTGTRSEAEAKKIAESLLAKAKGGADFAELAKESSEDPSASRNSGNLGYFTRGQMVKEFEEIAFSMKKPGEISGLVKSPFGFHIIKLHEHKPRVKMSFESVKSDIIEQLKMQMAKKLRQDKFVALRSTADLKFNTELAAQVLEELKK